ncbi:4-hydroxybenzoate octaprenyltransferase [Litorimonas haliclonae]|uniref:4-hydroxybenzoate octaprenyltransferase n=1 Tax=Litorimonas haliclonae TaxID=2081977 RepID=UPI0039EE48BF
MSQPNHIADSSKTHWVNRAPLSLRPYLQLSRLDRPIGYWLLTLPGWIGLSFGSLSYGFDLTDLLWATLILIGAIAMRGAGCTYNDIVDQDLDAKVERTALRPLPAGTITTKQAWIWVFAQCFVGLIVLFCLPRLAQIIALCSIPLVAAYPFMKRITWWPQVWLGLTFNWAVLVAYAAKTGEVSPPLLLLYAGLIFWTIGYDTIYACQDIEDDAMIGVKSTARRFGQRIKLGVGVNYGIMVLLIGYAINKSGFFPVDVENFGEPLFPLGITFSGVIIILLPLAMHLAWQLFRLNPNNGKTCLALFKSNIFAACMLVLMLPAFVLTLSLGI